MATLTVMVSFVWSLPTIVKAEALKVRVGVGAGATVTTQVLVVDKPSIVAMTEMVVVPAVNG